MTDHRYETILAWSGSTASGYKAYTRAHDVALADDILTLSADTAFRGDASLPNPEQVRLVREAHEGCYIANSLSAEIVLAPTVEVVA